MPGRTADPRLRLRDRDLHRTDARYHAHGVPAAIADRVEFGRYLPGQNASFGTVIPTPLPSRRRRLGSGVAMPVPNELFCPGGTAELHPVRDRHRDPSRGVGASVPVQVVGANRPRIGGIRRHGDREVGLSRASWRMVCTRT